MLTLAEAWTREDQPPTPKFPRATDREHTPM